MTTPRKPRAKAAKAKDNSGHSVSGPIAQSAIETACANYPREHLSELTDDEFWKDYNEAKRRNQEIRAMDLTKLLPFKDGGTDGRKPGAVRLRFISDWPKQTRLPAGYKGSPGWSDWSAAAARGDWP